MSKKRITGPSSVCPLVLDEKEISRDRSFESVRPTFMKTGILPLADGSSFVEALKLKIMCAVYGPRPDRRITGTDKGRLYVDYRTCTFASKQRKSFQRDATEKDYSQILCNALVPAVVLESFPKASVDVYVSVLEEDGKLACLAHAVTAVSLALADAGIEMRDIVTGCSAGVIDQVIMDVTDLEEQKVTGSLFLAFMPTLNQVTQIIQVGNMDKEHANEMMELCVDACAEIQACVRKSLTE